MGCDSVGKHPRTRNGLKNATTDANQVDKWWRQWPSANIGIVTGAPSGIVVIDIDPRHGGTKSLAALEQEHGALPPTVESLTGGSGNHLIFGYAGQAVGNRANVRPGIDVRGDGGYIVAPPSIHETGNHYRWRVGHAPSEIEPTSCPTWLLDLIQKQAAPEAIGSRLTTAADAGDDRFARCLQSLLKIRTADHKDGSKRLFAAACRCVEFDLTDLQAIACIRAYQAVRPFPRVRSDEDILVRLRDAEKRAERGKFLSKSTGAPSNFREPRPSYGSPYQVTEYGTVWMKDTKDGAVAVPLMNFSAKIIGEVLHDDGAETRLEFEIEARHKGLSYVFTESAGRFTAMNWPTENLGASAILYPGQGIKDRARCAVQMLSGEVPRRTVYTHLGWRNIADQWVYLHGVGAIASKAPVFASVDLPGPLQHYALPQPPTGDELRKAVHASMAILDLAPDVVTVPVWLAAWCATLITADFSILLCGPTGGGKTELAALAQQHFGAGLDARHLPANWSSTSNSLEALAFAAKDALLVVDDFAPGGTAADIARFHRDADRLLRAQGNQAGRGRLTSDARLRPGRPPRGLILSTGEDVPRGHSVRARALIVELPPGGMNWTRLGDCQRAGADGVYATAMAGFIRWIATDREKIVRDHGHRIAELRIRCSNARRISARRALLPSSLGPLSCLPNSRCQSMPFLTKVVTLPDSATVVGPHWAKRRSHRPNIRLPPIPSVGSRNCCRAPLRRVGRTSRQLMEAIRRTQARGDGARELFQPVASSNLNGNRRVIELAGSTAMTCCSILTLRTEQHIK